MNNTIGGPPKAPWHLWVIGIVSLLWNGGGAYDYTMTQTRNEAYLRAAADNAGVSYDMMMGYFTGFPAWADAFWALGVWGAVAGSILLLLRSRFAFHGFVISLIGLAGTTLYTFTSDIPAEMKSPFMWIFSAVIVIVTILLAIYARRMTAAGVLR
ncbi:hypothetical protein [Qipengyuania nanhaisediminis]|uniref:hypothetical protein n=1 Tax=Qipengyuania nanhaisediminis TaxID=604088 RepID=UPI0038B3933C